VRLEGVNLVVSYSGRPRLARITAAWADKNRVRAGETVTITVGLKPYREDESLEVIPTRSQGAQSGRFTPAIGERAR
jgi:hypothetical protein